MTIVGTVTVSIVVPLYHGIKYIDSIISMAEANESLLKKSFSDAHVEVVLVNDFPDDEKNLHIKQGKSVDVKVVKHFQNRGIHRSRVDGMKVSKGEYILFLDQDDEIEDDYGNLGSTAKSSSLWDDFDED